MNHMANDLTYLIRKTVDRDTILRQGLARSLISPRALASYIMKIYPEKQLNVEALRTAIRRMADEFKEVQDYQNHSCKFIKDAKIHLRSGIVKIAFLKGDASLELINSSIKALEIYGGDTFRVTKGQKILHVLVDEDNLDKIKNVFSERILEIEKDVVEFIVILPKESYVEYGIWAPFINEIAINKISLVDTFSCATEISIFVKERDRQKTFNVLEDMIERAKKTFIEKSEPKKEVKKK